MSLPSNIHAERCYREAEAALNKYKRVSNYEFQQFVNVNVKIERENKPMIVKHLRDTPAEQKTQAIWGNGAIAIKQTIDDEGNSTFKTVYG